mmetsp:Transcript_11004/g.32876  ORF Transcript_11004/g.32876 Transcript_11004/m.32876 type:complete len:222 (+) Transcript_11004:64-729(+)
MAAAAADGVAEDDTPWELLEEGKVEKLLKEGELRKRAIGKGRIGRTNWRTRWFRLTESGLAYYADRVAETPKGAIRTEQMHSVRISERMPSSFELIHYHFNPDSGEIRQKEYMLLCDCGSDYKRDEWILALKEMIHSNKCMKRTSSMKMGKVSRPAAHTTREWDAEVAGAQSAEAAFRPRLYTDNFTGFEDDETPPPPNCGGADANDDDGDSTEGFGGFDE